MKRSEKYNSVNPQVQTQSSLSSSIRVGLAALALPIILRACPNITVTTFSLTGGWCNSIRHGSLLFGC